MWQTKRCVAYTGIRWITEASTLACSVGDDSTGLYVAFLSVCRTVGDVGRPCLSLKCCLLSWWWWCLSAAVGVECMPCLCPLSMWVVVYVFVCLYVCTQLANTQTSIVLADEGNCLPKGCYDIGSGPRCRVSRWDSDSDSTGETVFEQELNGPSIVTQEQIFIVSV